MERAFQEVLFNWLDIAFEGQDKWWEPFDELVNQGDLNRNEWKNQQIIDVEEKGTGNTDNSQEEGINGLDEEDRSDSPNVIDHTTTFE